MKSILILVALILSYQANNVYAFDLKVTDPTDSSRILVLSDLNCARFNKASDQSKSWKLYGKERGRRLWGMDSLGCYEFDDSKKLLRIRTFADETAEYPIRKIKAINDETGKEIVNANLLTVESRQKIGDMQRKQGSAPEVSYTPIPPPQTPMAVSAGRIIGSSFDSQANGNIFLYDGPCQYANFASSYPNHWDAKRADSGELIGDGCYSFNSQSNQVFIIASTGKVASLPMSEFQGGSNKSAFQSFAEGLQRATNYWNNSANETQRNTTNLTPTFGGGNRNLNCTPDGRGGYYCK